MTDSIGQNSTVVDADAFSSDKDGVPPAEGYKRVRRSSKIKLLKAAFIAESRRAEPSADLDDVPGDALR